MQPEAMQDATSRGGRRPAAPLLGSFLQRAILATDGTVTNLIEAFVEPVYIEKLDEQALAPGVSHGWPELAPDLHVVRREVLIRGRRSGRVFLHAESLIVLEHLDDILRRELLETDKPIGKLIREYRRESYRELLGQRREAAGPRAAYFDCAPEAAVVARVYRIHLGGRAAIQITERFPDEAYDARANEVSDAS